MRGSQVEVFFNDLMLASCNHVHEIHNHRYSVVRSMGQLAQWKRQTVLERGGAPAADPRGEPGVMRFLQALSVQPFRQAWNCKLMTQ